MAVNMLKYIDDNSHYIFYDQKVVINKGGSVISDKPNDVLQSFYGEETKMFFFAFSSYFHFIHDFLAPLLYFYEQDNDTLFVISLELITKDGEVFEKFKKEFELLNLILKDNNIKHTFINPTTSTAFNINKFKRISVTHPGLFNSDDIIFKYIKKYIKDLNVEPFRKTYVSRSMFSLETKDLSFDYNFKNHNVEIRSSFDYPKTYNRLDDDLKFDQYMKDLGYEVIDPEVFDNIIDQINYFYECKTIASVSGSGLTNAMFMRQNTLMIEFITPLSAFSSSNVEYAQHLFYIEIAGERRLSYFGIPNFSRNSDKLIEHISLNKPIENFLRSC